MNQETINLIICAIFGYSYFLYELESPDMGNVLFRTNSDGVKEFSFASLIEIMKAPFIHKQFWTQKELLHVNWIFTTGMCVAIGFFYNKL